MGKHTLRYLDEQKHKVKKKKDPKNSFIKTHLEIIFAILVLIVSAMITNIILFADEFFYVNGCTLGYKTDCAANISLSATTVYVILMLLPLAFAIFAIIRAYQKKQKKSAIATAILAVIVALTPLIIPGIYSTRISQYDKTVVLSIEASDNGCKLVGVTPNSNSTCQVHSGAVPFMVDKLHNTAQIIIKNDNDIIAIHLDTDLNIFNITKQNLHVCAYIDGSPTANCRSLNYSNETANVQEDTYYTYSYLQNKLTITPKR